MFKIGNVEVSSPVILAPMAGISNPSYMKILEEMGCSLAYTELISAEAIVRGNAKTFDMLNGIDDLKLHVAVQLFGSDADVIAHAALIITKKYKVDIIDINMGCPVPKVSVRAHAGSALLRDVDKVSEIVSKVVSSVNVPVTVKIRSGWDSNHINASLVARAAYKAGASAIAIHPRTRSQGYSGNADWNIIKEVVESVPIPVIGNGDIKTIYDAKKMMDLTGCTAVMIGRAALGNPWLIKNCIEYLDNGVILDDASFLDKLNMMKYHFSILLKNRNEHIATLEIRSQAAWYLKGVKNAGELKNSIFKVKTANEFYKLIDDFIGENYES